MSSHHPRSGSAAAPTPSPHPPTSEGSSSSQPSSSSRSRGRQLLSQSQSQAHSQRKPHQARPLTSRPAEEQPGLEVVDPSTLPGDRVGRSRTRRTGTAPSFWSSKVAANPSQFTFYRDPTPTPPEYREREKDGEYMGSPLPRRPGRSSTIALETALSIPPPNSPTRSSRRETICGLRRWLFFCVAAAILLVVAIAVGVGVGVSVGTKSNDPAQSTRGSSSSMPTSTASPTTNPPVSSSSPASSTTSSSASSIPTASTDCPFINNTIYQLPGSNKSFLRLCGIDYSGASEAVELANVPTFSFADCIGNCAGTYGCTGCAWGIVSKDEGANHQCWMKGDLKTGHEVAPDWCFAVLE